MIITHKIVNTEYRITDGTHTILCNVANRKISLFTDEGNQFSFIDREPEKLKAIAEMIAYAGGIA